MEQKGTKAGVYYEGPGRCTFNVWAPCKKSMTLHLVAPREEKLPMKKTDDGYFTLELQGITPGTRYFFGIEEGEVLPDPCSFSQPDGVHGPSEVVDHNVYKWGDEGWRGLPLEKLVFYELHVGTFTPEGSFEAIIPRLDELLETGITALELMPVGQFPGSRNWGYDGVFPYAVQNSYGGPEGLRKLVDACHAKGMAVFLDVVYNHLGPEGNHLGSYGPYFTAHYRTPWGDALNFDGHWSDGVRDYFSENPVYWSRYFHIDGLRADAIHTIFDYGAVHFWELTHQKITEERERSGRPFYLTAESDLNSPRVARSPEEGGWGFDAQWLDDFHHAMYVLLHNQGKEFYGDFGSVQQLAKAYTDGFVHSGEYVRFRKRKYGASSAGIPGTHFVAFNSNHDQVGNRVGGERLNMLVDRERVKLAAGALLLSPYIPLLFMGEEYGDDSPFYYFVSHSDEELIRAVQKGRMEDFKAFGFDSSALDPQSEDCFNHSKIHWEKRLQEPYRSLLNWHRELLRLRRTLPALCNFDKSGVGAEPVSPEALLLTRRSADGRQTVLAFLNFSEEPVTWNTPDEWLPSQKILDSRAPEWMNEQPTGNGVMPGTLNARASIELPPLSLTVYRSGVEV